MAQEIQKFDPATLMQGVKDRIKATFVSLIPDEQWEVMVKSEIDRFFKVKRDYNSSDNTSDFSQVVNSVLRKEAEDKIQEILKSPDFQINWNGNEYTLPEYIRGEVVKHAHEIFASAISGAISNAIQTMRR